MRLWRISRYPGLDGAGGLHVDGRWHSKPRAVVYAAEHPALAMVEVMAHMLLDTSAVPTTLRLMAIDVKARAKRASEPELADGWQANQLTTQALGNSWLDECRYLLMPVRSAVIAHSTNWLINPNHPQAATHLVETDCGPFWFDQRLY